MIHTKGKILSRHRNGVLELVDEKTGALTIEAEHPLDEAHQTSKESIPGMVHWPQRGLSYLRQLRKTRLEFLRESQRSFRKKKERDPNKTTTRARTKKPTKMDKKIEDILANKMKDLPPEVAAQLASMRRTAE